MSESTEPIHDRVDEFITDPIAVSIQSTLSDERLAFRDPDKLDRHSLFEARTLDIWDSASGSRCLDQAYPLSRGLPPRLFDAWHPDSNGNERLALRLLITRPKLASSLWAWHDDLQTADMRQINYLPFVPEAVEDLIHQYDLPRDWPYLRLQSREVGNFIRRTEWDFSGTHPRARRIGKNIISQEPSLCLTIDAFNPAFVIHFPFVLRPARREDFLNEYNRGRTAGRRNQSVFKPRIHDPFIWSFAMSHSLRDGKTRGILDGITNRSYADVVRRILKANNRWYQHPLHVPVVLLSIFLDNAAWEINRSINDVDDFEKLSRDAGVSSLEKFDIITTELQCLKRTLQFQESITKSMLDTLQFLETKVFVRPPQSPDLSAYESYFHKTNPHIEEKLKNMLNLIENNSQTCLYLQSRSKDALDYINGAIRLREDKSNREDADSNKVMSFLQMTFLPATGVAAVLSMGAFNWDDNPPSVKPSFWVWGVFAILMTLIVLGAYYGNKMYKKAQENREDEEAKAREDREAEDMTRPPMADPYPGDGIASGNDVTSEKRNSRKKRRSRTRRSRPLLNAEAV